MECHPAHKIKDFKKLEIVNFFIKSLITLPFFAVEKWFTPFWNQYPTAIYIFILIQWGTSYFYSLSFFTGL